MISVLLIICNNRKNW